jgi:hypothetical protein
VVRRQPGGGDPVLAEKSDLAPLEIDGERVQVTFVDTEGKVRYETEIRK